MCAKFDKAYGVNISENFHNVREEVIESITKELCYKDPSFIPIDLEKQACALAAVKAAGTYDVFQKYITSPTKISRRSFQRAQALLKEKADYPCTYAELLRPNGRPRKYLRSVDDAFMTWLEDITTPTIDKTMFNMVKKYTDLWSGMADASERPDCVDPKPIRRHIWELLKNHGYVLRRPKIIDAKRCITYETLDAWYKNPDVAKALTNMPGAFVFNADETEINRKGGCPGMVVAKKKEQPCIVMADRSGSHASLFIIISAAGELINPTCLLHGKPDHFDIDPKNAPQIACYRTENGYMDRATFKKIMKEVFIRHVNIKRELFNCPTQRAVLIVDGHSSRYDDETFQMLRDENIDLLIIPAHSSHLTQPLDLGLNKHLKAFFNKRIRYEPDPTLFLQFRPTEFPEEEDESDKPPALVKRKRGRPRKDAPSEKTPEINFRRTKKADATVLDPAEVPPPPLKRKHCGRKKQSSAPIVSSGAEQSVPESGEESSTPTASESTKFNLVDMSKVSNAAYERMRTIDAARNALTALNPANILSAWRTTHLFPFQPVPPVHSGKGTTNAARTACLPENLT